MKTYVLILTAAVAFAIVLAGGTQSATAQWLAQYGVVSQGTFGPRVIGRPLVVGNQTESIFGPRSLGSPVSGPGNYFAPNAQIIPNGFLVSSNPYSGNQAITPLSTYSTQVAGLQPPDVNNFLISSMTPETTSVQGVGATAQGVPANPSYSGYSGGAVATASPTGASPTGATPSGTAAGANPNASAANTGAAAQTANPATMPTVTGNVTPQRGKFRTATASPTGPQPFALSHDLSERLTSIARNRGMLVSNGINVYLSNDAALIQGVVRTPSDRAALASVLGLEPEVARIDNRLQVGAAAK
jgi:hypothetical protein